MVDLTCKKDGCSEVVTCDEGTTAVTCSLCSMADVFSMFEDVDSNQVGIA